MSEHTDLDPFWVEQRAQFLAEKSTSADPSACGTCRSLVEAGKPVEHDECAQRATLLHAPDHPHYEILAGFSLEENAKLPARFHVPVFDDCGVPNSWLCAVCQEEGVVTGWPCATATKYGAQVFTPLHEAETAQAKLQAATTAQPALPAPVGDQPQPLDDQRLAEIAARVEAATSGPWGVYEYGGGGLLDIAADLKDTGTGYRARRTIARLEDEPLDNDPTHREWTAEEDWEQVKADAAFIAHAPTDVRALLAEVRHLRDQQAKDDDEYEKATAELAAARARIAELEHPAVEAKRNEVRDSFTELAAAARETRDYEGAFKVECDLREREEQWKCEDEEAAR
ncbi:hypothetical protein [Streptomyces prasinus]|uniref:hypothetical protein n=1 Tax=Streptomyces prasinus TaxID=67345 RepID=UPI0036BDDD3E